MTFNLFAVSVGLALGAVLGQLVFRVRRQDREIARMGQRIGWLETKVLFEEQARVQGELSDGRMRMKMLARVDKLAVEIGCVERTMYAAAENLAASGETVAAIGRKTQQTEAAVKRLETDYYALRTRLGRVSDRCGEVSRLQEDIALNLRRVMRAVAADSPAKPKARRRR